MNLKKYYYPLLFLFFISVPRMVDASVIFSEVAWMGTPESANAEWIEFYNTSSELIDMSGWKLYESGGSTLVYTFTKQIPGKTYFVLERVTPSAPDPLPDIGDESGSFGGSGLSNSGEYLVLKNTEGVVVTDLDASSGWQAGESAEKKTMQRSNGTWISASPTPKAPPQTGTIDGAPDVSPPSGGSSASHTGSQPPPPPPRSTTSYIKATFPEQVFRGQQSTFTFTSFVGGDERIHGYFYWNMGDGTVYEFTKSEKVKHTYTESGKYPVTISFGYSPYVEPVLIETILVSVLDPSLALTLENQGNTVVLSYTGEGVLDIGKWVLASQEGSYVFPLHTRLLGGTAVRVKSTSLFPFGPQSVFSLNTNEHIEVATLGSKLAEEKKPLSIQRKVLGASSINVLEKTLPVAPSTKDSSVEKVESSHKKSTSAVIFGGLLVFLIGLFVFLDRMKIQEQEE